MAKIVIKKRIDLDFLGEDYTGGYINFKTLSVKDVEDLRPKIDAVGDDNEKATKIFMDICKENFIGGVFKDGESEQKIEVENLDDFSPAHIIKFTRILSGQEADPKD